MKRLFLTAALLPLVLASAARAETKITNGVTTPLKTSTAANGAPDDLTIDTGGSVKPAAGVAVTLDSNNAVKNLGGISFNNVDNATGVLALGGHSGLVSNTGTINLLEDFTPPDTDNDGVPDGQLAKGTGRFGIRVTGPGAFTGDIRNETGGSITIEGNNSAGISVETQLTGNLVNAGTLAVTGDHAFGISAQHVTGDVRVTGGVTVAGTGATAVALDDVDGAVQLQNTISSTGFKTTQRLADADRAKLDADDLQLGGSTVRITGSVGKGILLDKPPTADPKNPDVDKDGTPDAQEGTAALTSFGSAAALDLGSSRATTIGAVGTGDNAFGLVIKGLVTGNGVNDGIGATAIRIGQVGGGTTTLAGGINNLGGTIQAGAFGADVRANGGEAVALLINAGAVVPALVNSGTIQATLVNGAQDAHAILDKSGSLQLIQNSGVISASVTPKTGSTNVGQAVAIDLSANTTGATIQQSNPATGTASITGDVLLGSGADHLVLLGGTLTGAMSFGAGADSLVIDGGAQATGRLTDSDGQLTLDIRQGRLAVANSDSLQISSLNLGAKGVLAFTLDPAAGKATHFQVSGPAVIADGGQIEITLASLLKTPQSFELIKAGSLQAGAAGASLVGAPFLYAATLKADTTAGALSVDVRTKTPTELGLNRSGGQAFAAVFANLDHDAGVENAILAQKTQAGFLGVYDQLLPDHSGGSLMSAAAISSAVSQAIGQALPHESAGGSAAWAQEIAFHIDRDREQAAGYTSRGFGLAAGGEVVGEANALGLDVGFVTAEYKDKNAAIGERVDMNFLEGGTYWRLRAGGLQADARAAVGYVWFDSDRRVTGDGLARAATSSWSGWLVDLHTGASYTASFGRFYARPEVSLDYVRLNEGGYQESGGGVGVNLNVDSRDGDLLTGQGLIAFGWEFGDEVRWAPEVKLGWREKLTGGPGVTTARFQGGSPFTLDAEDPAASGAVVRLGFRIGDDQFFFAFDGGAVLDDRSREYDALATIRFKF